MVPRLVSRGPAALGRTLLHAAIGALALAPGCSFVTTWEDCTSDRDCRQNERCHPTRRYCEVPVVELCNGSDDDRDGVADADEDFGPCEPGGTPPMGARVCRDGVRRCRAGNQLECVRRTTPRAAETCNNGLDDDCNGVVDDGAACVQNYSLTRGLIIGSNDPGFGEGDDEPEHPVCLADFSIDRYEVTFEAFVTWLNSLDPRRVRLERPPAPLNATQVYGRYITYNDNGTVVPLVLLPEPADWSTIASGPLGFAPLDPTSRGLPVVNVTWLAADRYCRWAGKHLPTEAEYFRATRGADGRRPFPWGGEAPTCQRANVGAGGTLDGGLCVGRLVPVGSLRAGANPEGVFDLYGNASEWMWDWLNTNPNHTRNNYYQSLPPTMDAWCMAHPNGPLGPATGAPINLPSGSGTYCQQCRFARGRHFRSVDLRVGIRRWLDADRTDDTVGFRCSLGGAMR